MTAPRISWFTAQLKPNASALAERNLHRQGFATFMPQVERDERSPDGFRRVRRPLFPGYLFVGFDPDGNAWRPVSSTRGVARLVSFGGQAPRPVNDALIDSLKRNTDEAGIFRHDAGLVAGAEVVVLTGPFADFCAKVHSLDDAGRAWVLLDLLGQQTRVQLRHEHLRRA